MLSLRMAGIPLVILMSLTGRGAAQEGNTLTFEEALTLARERAPIVRAARARIEEARGRLDSASVRLRGNPILEGNAGRRTAAGEEFTELEVGLTQGLGAVGWRRDRMAGAEAGLSSEIATSEEVPKRPENLSWAWMKGCSGYSERWDVSTRTIGPGSGCPKALVAMFTIG